MPACTDPPPDDAQDTLRVAVVPGVTIGRWAQTWRERVGNDLTLIQVPAHRAEADLLAGHVDAAFLRLPLRSAPPVLRIPLWQEVSVAALSRENPLTLLDELHSRDLAEETLIVAEDDVLAWSTPPGLPFTGPPPATTQEALDLVAAEAGICVLPQAIARAAHRRDVLTRPVTDAPTSQVALAWLPLDGETPAPVETLIGIVRGRTVNSTRGARTAGTAQAATTSRPSAPRSTPRSTRANRTRRRPGR
ncbi:LysR substrate-binding domain-containing protein [Serinibacter salmoneus]|uniref:LysR substrate binding domain-containing protein n=1 Tax=Serinibacter salmoneus TaxID=556530 RepID=A0A2A9CYL7_9MICO|nr:LysR substrate-binding domain-containing protein [Serinibacter salmoneus]PFG19527.1 LysR substrate binding domain-containing protein [Serinibacter salmoneus]